MSESNLVLKEGIYWWNDRIKLKVPPGQEKCQFLCELAFMIEPFADCVKTIIKSSKTPFAYDVKFGQFKFTARLSAEYGHEEFNDGDKVTLEWITDGRKTYNLLKDFKAEILEAQHKERLKKVCLQFGNCSEKAGNLIIKIQDYGYGIRYNGYNHFYHSMIMITDQNGITILVSDEGEAYTCEGYLLKANLVDLFDPRIHELVNEITEMFVGTPRVAHQPNDVAHFVLDDMNIRVDLNTKELIQGAFCTGLKTLQDALDARNKRDYLRDYLKKNWTPRKEFDDEVIKVRILEMTYDSRVYVKAGEDIYHIYGKNPLRITFPVKLYEEYQHIFKRDPINETDS